MFETQISSVIFYLLPSVKSTEWLMPLWLDCCFFALSTVSVCPFHLTHRIFAKSQLVSDACSLVSLSSSRGSERFSAVVAAGVIVIVLLVSLHAHTHIILCC